jgi:hypothetical protein
MLRSPHATNGTSFPAVSLRSTATWGFKRHDTGLATRLCDKPAPVRPRYRSLRRQSIAVTALIAAFTGWISAPAEMADLSACSKRGTVQPKLEGV